MSIDAQLVLFQAIKAHTAELEIEQDGATGPDPKALDGRVEAARRLLEWIEQALEPHPSVSSSPNAAIIELAS